MVGLVAAAVVVPLAHASRAASAPIAVVAAAVGQTGEDLAWSVQTQTPFSPRALAAGGGSLCLVVQQVRSVSAAGQLCLIGPPAGGRTPRLEYLSADGRRAIVAATVTRTGSRQLTATFLT